MNTPLINARAHWELLQPVEPYRIYERPKLAASDDLDQLEYIQLWLNEFRAKVASQQLEGQPKVVGEILAYLDSMEKDEILPAIEFCKEEIDRG